MRHNRRVRPETPANDNVNMDARNRQAHVHMPDSGIDGTRIRAATAAKRDTGLVIQPARIRAKSGAPGVRRPSQGAETAIGFTCDSPSPPSKQVVARILTSLPERIPVLPGEIALLETYWGAILDLMAANDNDAD